MTNNSILPYVADATTTTIGGITPLWGIGSIDSRVKLGGKKLNTNTVIRMKKASHHRHIDIIATARRSLSNGKSNTIADFQNGIVSHIVEGLNIELSHGWRF